MQFTPAIVELLETNTSAPGVAAFLRDVWDENLMGEEPECDFWGNDVHDASNGKRVAAARVHLRCMGRSNNDDDPMCYRCQEGQGPFVLCCNDRRVYFGACTNCVWNGRGQNCSFVDRGRFPFPLLGTPADFRFSSCAWSSRWSPFHRGGSQLGLGIKQSTYAFLARVAYGPVSSPVLGSPRYPPHRHCPSFAAG